MKKIIFGLSIMLFQATGAHASAGLTLLEPANARPFAMGEAYSANQDDIAAFHYNPASLSSLSLKEVSFFYRQGVFNDSYTHLALGGPSSRGGFGGSVGYYNGGETEVFDGENVANVAGQRDIVLSLGYGIRRSAISVGTAVKYFSSTLAETEKATAYAADFGLQYQLDSRWTFGGAIQNLGTHLRYADKGDPLPRLVRAGLRWQAFVAPYPISLSVEDAYLANDQTHVPSVGFEAAVSPLVLRAGYKSNQGQNVIAAGAGFLAGNFSIDYSMAMIQSLDAQHLFSVSHRFGGSTVPTIATIEQPVIQKNTPAFSAPPVHKRMYQVQDNDTWNSIAIKVYGDESMAARIRLANLHLLSNGNSLPHGKKIVLP